MGQSTDRHNSEPIQQTIEYPHTEHKIQEHSLFDWVQLWMPFLLVIIPIWFAWKQAKLKADASNKERLKKAIAEHKESEHSDKTVLQWARGEMARIAKENKNE